ncbi:Lnb N-terminal periplasmic domain-containing protein [Rheinheimera sp. UJ63]|uniref:Lnb N-terminal periplasmic domain-containing protein n=1 Tax=Rheinheimera sp. UJ63 TaxID=2910157 RepID=UPI001F414B6C|nr:DUF4105 domain-containing protein [Rheinheimera sp. UJ63]MCF4008787.1 DUF4105 domain-containing protein [Rheinheimera sp. UJ63]
MKLIIAMLGSLLAFSTWSASAPRFIEQAAAKNLAADRYWLALLHKRDAETDSEIIDPHFFLSNTQDASAELNATLKALLAPVTDDVNEHAQCRFIARSHWLQQQLPELKQALPELTCTLFETWSDQQQVDHVSMIFASGYLGNPASFYGHILLKFGSASERRALLQQQNINFGAAVPAAENPLVYILNGLFGGYNAVFSYGDFYRNTQAYGETELRDLWEYQLALNPSEVSQLLYHAWELIGRDYVYYFLKENCAFRMAELLELVIQQPLINKTQPYAMPISVFHRVAELEHHGQPLVAKVIQHPSRQKRLVKRFEQVAEPVQAAVAELIENEYQIENSLYAQLNAAEQTQTLEILFDYIEFRKVAADDPQPLTTYKNRLLQVRLKLPAGKASPVVLAESPPHLATLPSLLQISAIHKEQSNGLELRFRATYYDLLTANRDNANYSALSMVDVHVRQEADRLQLYRFDLLNIENMNLSQTGLPQDGGFAWKLNAGYAPQDLACQRCQTLQLIGGLGKAMQLQQGVVYAMQDGRLHENRHDVGLLSTDTRLGTVFNLDARWRIQAEFGYRAYLTGEASNFYWYKLQQRFGQSQHWDIRLILEKQRATEFKLAFSYYW